MLSRNQVLFGILPKISPLSIENKETRPNIIKKSIINNKSEINLYLPFNKILYKKEFKKSRLSDLYYKKENKAEIKKENLISHKKSFSNGNLNQNYTNPKRKKLLLEGDFDLDETIHKIRNLIKNEREKINKIENNVNKNTLNYGEQGVEYQRPFHINELKKKVNEIVKDVHSDYKQKYNLVFKFKHHAIENKKNTRVLTDFFESEKSKDNLYMQKINLNNEFNNVIVKYEKNKDDPLNIFYKVNSIDIFDNNKKHFNTELNENQNNKSIKNNKKQLYDKIKEITSEKKFENNILNNEKIIEKLKEEKENIKNNKIKQSEFLNNNNFNFIQKYHKTLKKIDKEKQIHKHKKVFSNDQIDKLIKSRNQLDINKLMNDYKEKLREINKHKITKENSNTKMNIVRNLQEEKERIFNKKNGIINKLNTAIYNNINGNIGVSLYNIEDYIN